MTNEISGFAKFSKVIGKYLINSREDVYCKSKLAAAVILCEGLKLPSLKCHLSSWCLDARHSLNAGFYEVFLYFKRSAELEYTAHPSGHARMGYFISKCVFFLYSPLCSMIYFNVLLFAQSLIPFILWIKLDLGRHILQEVLWSFRIYSDPTWLDVFMLITFVNTSVYF